MSTLALKRRTPSLGAIPTVPPSPAPCTMPLPSPSIKTPPSGSSLYHTCRLVLDKLALVEGITSSPSMIPVNTTSDGTQTTNDFSNDPLSKLCCLCRRGTPLFTLFNALNTKQPLKMDPNPKLNQLNNCKANVYHFLVACRQQLLFPEEEVFTVSDLYVDDTNGFVKVVNTVQKILQLLEEKGIISSHCSSRDSCPLASPKGIRDKVVLELLATERKYVQDLETLQNYMRELQQQRILSQDTVHYLFGNLNALVDFQRRFLIQMEKTAENDPKEQHFGLLFSQMEGAFSVYEPYCSNYYSAQDLVVQEAPKLMKLSDIINPTYELPSLLIKPIQRICKYPLLLNELIKSTEKNWSTVSEMMDGLESMRRVADKVNETQRKHENLRMVGQLKHRVDDWKGISIDKCGQLLLQDKIFVRAYNNEREMHVFFFENRLLLFKESKDNSKSRLTKASTISVKKRRRGTLEPRGIIETSTITCLHNMSGNGEWSLIIEWKEQDVGQVALKFRNEEQYKLWEMTLNKQKGFKIPSSSSSTSSSPDLNVFKDSSIPEPLSNSGGDNWSFIDPDDEEDEVDFIEDDIDELGSSRSRSNSFSTHFLNTFSTRNKTGRNNSSDVSAIKSSATTTPITGRSNTPGLNLQPLPRSACDTMIHQTSPPNSHISGDYFFYPSSPPPSNPSSPTSSSRVSPNISTPDASFRENPSSHHVYHQHQKEFEKMKITGPPPSDKIHQHRHPSVQPHARSRAQSSPTIQSNRRHDKEGILSKSTTWEQYPTIAKQSTAPIKMTPRLSDKETSASLQSHLDRVLTAAGTLSPGQIKVKVMYNEGKYSIMVPQQISYTELLKRVEQKLQTVGDIPPVSTLRLKYRDEEGDFITINSNDDVQMAFESYWHSNVLLFVSL
ncbi:uncharacterized protein BX664DRAFT_300963 [Halteromyces radiatus]|uniref:uncharacterized protein n=1 Tax=Halteromyces radiatus TaxID=101107 RepID=UPI00221F4695|nr:uncharacterized protein BX664DRAFT_300963 [Halteromyces radiatus]KAI8085178.1 hypothetical protein BX664DRAFT_300963 [Halteromyces radiatus]